MAEGRRHTSSVTERQENVKQAIKYFDTFLELYENTTWMETATESDVKSAFKLASFLEKLYQKFESCNSVTDFQRIIQEWWESKGRTSPSDLAVFEEASDLLLTAFLNNPKVPNNNVFVAIDEYVLLCSKSRLNELMDNLLTEGISFRILFIMLSSTNKDVTELVDLDLVFMSVWCKKLECGNKDIVCKQISGMLKDANHLEIFMKMLAEKNENEEKRDVKLVILENILLKMKDRTDKSLVFWHELISSVDKQLTVNVSKTFPDFLSALFDFIIFVGKDIVCECRARDSGMRTTYEWKTKSENAFLSGQEFGDVVQLLKCLFQLRGRVGNRVRQWLENLKSGPGCTLWEDIEALCD